MILFYIYKLNPSRLLVLGTAIWAFMVLIAAPSFGQSIRISEIMADNKTTLLDEDGDASDWIELYNTTGSPIDLNDWYLTDDPSDLTKWQFPATTIPSNGFLVVFASNKDRSNAGQELHTNFKLSASGEQVALVQSDGVDIEDEITFTTQDEDISYGYEFLNSSLDPLVVLEPGVPCTAHIPTSAADATGWTEKTFNETGWLSGNTGVGYDAGSDYTGLIGLNVSAMRDVNPSVYIRVPFTIADPTDIRSMTLQMKYDDAFVAYINGTQVTASDLAPSTPQWNSSAEGYHDDAAAVIFQPFSLDEHAAVLQPGTNVLAIHGLNYLPTSSDLIMMPKLEILFSGGTINLVETGLLATPTPGTENAAIVYSGYADTPVTTPERGFYDAPIQVSVSNTTVGATIRYTLDGSEPTSSSTAYTGPLSISSTKNLRVRAFKNGWKASYPRTDTYIFTGDVVLQPESETVINGQEMVYGMNQGVVNKTYYDASNQVVTVQDALKAIPTISITTADANLYSPSSGIYVNAMERWERPASAELINPDGTKGFHINAGLRIRGGASRDGNFPKHSFRLFFRDDYGEGKLKFQLFENEGVDEFKKIDLRTPQNYSWAYQNSSKNTFLRDVFSRDSAGAMGNAYTRSRYYHLYLNGKYWGMYMTEERPVADFGASYFGGDSDDYDVIKASAGNAVPSYATEVTDGTFDAYHRLFDAAMAGFSDNADYFSVQGLDVNGNPDPSHERLLDVENMIDYLLGLYYVAAGDNGIIQWLDGKLNNLYAFYNRVNPDGFKWIQHDCEHSLDTYLYNTDITGPFNHPNFSTKLYFNAQTLHDKLRANAEYKLKFADRVHKHLKNNGAVVRANSEARFDFRAAQIDRAIVAHAARWGSTSRDRDTWINAVANTRLWFARSGDRCNEVIGYLAADGLIPSINPPTLSLAGGLINPGTTVSLSAASGTIYYTTDGTDPRAIGGSISGTVYGSPISITKPVHLKARARSSGGTWSALAEATFWTPKIPLAVTELMYHAPNGDRHDFIEVQNISAETVTLKGYKLDNAIDFKFKNATQTSLAPGEYLVAVDDIDAFNDTYSPSGVNIAGEFSGNLNNSGEKVDLEFRNNDLISFTYDDARNWPQAADGSGHSLVPLDSALGAEESGSLDYGGNWRASTYANGSPGYADPAAVQAIMLNEIIAHTDTGLAAPYDSNDKIELFNPTGSAITLNGWYLSDHLDNPTKWAIPNGTIIPAFGFLAFDEDDFHPDRVIGFGLDKAGEQVILSASGHVVDAIRFKGQENGVSLGRYPDGAAHWVTTLPSPAAPNQPVSESVRISKVMYNPLQPGNDYEYIQLENIGNTAVAFENATGTYRIDGGVEFDFPTGTTLPAGEQLWILSFNPANTAKLNLFCSAYGLNPANETFLGGYKGELSDRGERVALERPQASDDPLTPLGLSWVVLDELFYFDQAPWPGNADGSGYPLLRSGMFNWIAPTATDTDGDLMDDDWEIGYFGSLEQTGSDWDVDGQSNLEEFIADSNPTNSSSLFIVESAIGSTLNWTPKSGRTYSVYWTDDLRQPFLRIAYGLTSGSYADTAHAAAGQNYYQITVEM